MSDSSSVMDSTRGELSGINSSIGMDHLKKSPKGEEVTLSSTVISRE